MTTLTIICAMDSQNNLVNPATGKCWDIEGDRKYFRDTIAGKQIICGSKTFLEDCLGFDGAASVTVMTRGVAPMKAVSDRLASHVEEFQRRVTAARMEKWKKGGNMFEWGVAPFVHTANSVCGAIAQCFARYHGDEELFCVGGGKTIKAFAPFASRLLLTYIYGESQEFVMPEGFLGNASYPVMHWNSADEAVIRTRDLWSRNIIYHGGDFVRYELKRNPVIELR